MRSELYLGDLVNQVNQLTMASNGEVVATRFGDYYKYEVVKWRGKYIVKKDGTRVAGTFGSLRDAVEWAEEESGDKR